MVGFITTWCFLHKMIWEYKLNVQTLANKERIIDLLVMDPRRECVTFNLYVRLRARQKPNMPIRIEILVTAHIRVIFSSSCGGPPKPSSSFCIRSQKLLLHPFLTDKTSAGLRPFFAHGQYAAMAGIVTFAGWTRKVGYYLQCCALYCQRYALYLFYSQHELNRFAWIRLTCTE